MSSVQAPLKNSSFEQKKVQFVATWIFVLHFIGVFTFSWFAGAFIVSDDPAKYALMVVAASFVLSLPAMLSTLKNNLNFNGLALEYAGCGYFGGVLASAILVVRTVMKFLFQTDWQLLTANWAAAFVVAFAFLMALFFAGIYILITSKRRQGGLK